MLKLIKKEFMLAMHPITPVMLVLSAMVMIPNYPYVVMFFYTTMAVFFTCLLGRENNDVVYSLSLPVSKKSVVAARISFTIIVEMAQMLLLIPFCILSAKTNPAGNQAGIDANTALFATGFIVYAVFNLLFFTMYYKDVNKVGIAFVVSSAVTFVIAVIDVISTYAVPFVRDCLDKPDPLFIPQKLAYLAISIVIFAALTALTLKTCVKSFEKQDLN